MFLVDLDFHVGGLLLETSEQAIEEDRQDYGRDENDERAKHRSLLLIPTAPLTDVGITNLMNTNPHVGEAPNLQLVHGAAWQLRNASGLCYFT